MTWTRLVTAEESSDGCGICCDAWTWYVKEQESICAPSMLSDGETEWVSETKRQSVGKGEPGVLCFHPGEFQMPGGNANGEARKAVG